MTRRIEKAIDIFLDAINEGTLAKGTCAACACGNLISHGVGVKIRKVSKTEFRSDSEKIWGMPYFKKVALMDRPVDFIKAEEYTDFNKTELFLIERTFENNTNISHGAYDYYSKEEIRADQIRGLEAVVKVMLDFDDCKEEAKEVFTYKAELIEV